MEARVLAVDDRPDKRLAIATVLEGLDAQVELVSSGEAALRRLLAHDYAVILLDVHMPGMDGFETASMIRQRPRSRSTPILFVTAVAEAQAHVTRGYALGAVDFIFQPVAPEILRSKVSAFLDLYKRTQRIQAQEEIHRRRADALASRLDGLLDRLDVGVFRTTEDGKIIEGNRAFYELLGLEQATDPTKIRLPWLTQDTESEVEITRPDGSTFWGHLHRYAEVLDDGRRVNEGLLTDVTDRKLAELALVAKADELARSNADLERMAYLASHDLREPLRVVAMTTDLLQRSESLNGDEQARRLLGFAHDSAQHMQKMVGDLLAFSQLRGQAWALDDVYLHDSVDRAIRNLQASLQECGGTVTWGELPRVRGDGVLLASVFQNLVGNAIKFRGDRPLEVRIDARPADGDWELSVSDNGIGIDPGRHREVFDIFRRLHARERYDGTGIGLAVCRHVVERHGGRIWADPDAAAGATIRFTLPAASDAPVTLS